MLQEKRPRSHSTSGRIQYVRQEEAYLRYDRKTEYPQKKYEREAPAAELPHSDFSLLAHLTEFMAFIEDLTDSVLRRVQYAPFEMRPEGDQQEEIFGEGDEDGPSFYAQLVEEAQQKLAQQQDSIASQNGRGIKKNKKKDMPVNVALMVEVAWRWHNEVSLRRKPTTGLHAYCIMLSWAAFCKLFYLVVYENEQLYRLIKTHRATQYQYCVQVSAQENVIISSACLGMYSVQEVWLSLQQIVPSLYRNSFTPHMKTYLYALFFRYCDMMCTQQRAPRTTFDNPIFVKFTEPREKSESSTSSNEEDLDSSSENGNGGSSSSSSNNSSSEEEEDSVDSEDEQEEEDLDDEDDYDYYKKVLVPLSPTYSLRSAYFFEGQLIFLSQLKRILFSEALVSLCEQAPLRMSSGQRPGPRDMQRCEKSLCRMLSTLFVHKDLKQYIKEDFKAKLLSLYVYHGEAERFRARWPHASANPSDILAMLRPGDNQHALRIFKMTAQQMLAEPAKYEREMVLMTKCATRQWLYSTVGKADLVDSIDAHFMMEELATLHEIDLRVATVKGLIESNTMEEFDIQEDQPSRPLPLLLRLVGQYYVSHGLTGRLYQTTNFTEAYMIWLQLLCSGGTLSRTRHMHVDVKSCLSQFKVD